MADCNDSVVLGVLMHSLLIVIMQGGYFVFFGVSAFSTESLLLGFFESSLKEHSLFCQIQPYDHALKMVNSLILFPISITIVSSFKLVQMPGQKQSFPVFTVRLLLRMLFFFHC